MNVPVDDLAVYLHLARANERRHRHLIRDKLLVLAAVAAARRQLDPVAQFCRQKVLMHNPAHLVGRWPSLATAMIDQDFQYYVRRLGQMYPLEKAEYMLAALGIEMARERELYQDDNEYAAALLGISPERMLVELHQPVEPSRPGTTCPSRRGSRLAERVKALVRFLR